MYVCSGHLERLFVVERHEKTLFYKGFVWVYWCMCIWCKLFESVLVVIYSRIMPPSVTFLHGYTVRINPKIVHATWKNPNLKTLYFQWFAPFGDALKIKEKRPVHPKL